LRYYVERRDKFDIAISIDAKERAHDTCVGGAIAVIFHRPARRTPAQLPPPAMATLMLFCTGMILALSGATNDARAAYWKLSQADS
jgi:hypothetical protein